MIHKKSSLRISDSKRVISLRIIRIVGTIFCVIGILVGSYNIIRWQVEREIAAEQVNIVQDIVVQDVSDDDNTEVVETATAESDPYWDFIKMSMLDVDFNELASLNPETVGWVRMEGTNINYPFVQGSDNEYYLHHTFNRSLNSAGWVFLDYRDSKNLSENRNNILYAHGRVDGSMFGTLKNALYASWQNNSNNFVIKTSTPTESSLWQIFSVYKTELTSDYLKTDFAANNEFLAFAQILKNRSILDFHTDVAPTDRMLTLSTCIGNNDERMVVHAKLIKITPKV